VRPKRSRAANRLVVGEDVVDLVAAATGGGKAAHRCRLATPPGVEHLLGAGLRLVALVVIGAVVVVLGEAEIDHRAMPCVSKSHLWAFSASERLFLPPL